MLVVDYNKDLGPAGLMHSYATCQILIRLRPVLNLHLLQFKLNTTVLMKFSVNIEYANGSLQGRRRLCTKQPIARLTQLLLYVEKQ